MITLARCDVVPAKAASDRVLGRIATGECGANSAWRDVDGGARGDDDRGVQGYVTAGAAAVETGARSDRGDVSAGDGHLVLTARAGRRGVVAESDLEELVEAGDAACHRLGCRRGYRRQTRSLPGGCPPKRLHRRGLPR